jgi:2,4-diaminopentanoate dehydrogenase
VRTYRVVQWATGNIGARSLREVVAHPQLELVGVHVYSSEKVGRDAAELCGLGSPIGVTATGTLEEVIALSPNCVLYMPQWLDAGEVCALLEGGSNVVTTRGEFHRLASMEAGLRGRVEGACRAGGTSIHSTGSSPGFISEALPIVLTSIQRRLDRLVIEEYADLSKRDSPVLLFDIMRFGHPPAAIDERRLSHGRVSFGPSLSLLADALRAPLDDIDAGGAMAVATHDVTIAAGTIMEGTVAAQRLTVTGRRSGRPFIEFIANWYCTRDIDTSWDLRDTGWRVVVDGDAPLDVQLRFPTPLEHLGEVTPGYTANRAVNAVPYVCEAEPGIRTLLDLPQVVAHLGA